MTPIWNIAHTNACNNDMGVWMDSNNNAENECQVFVTVLLIIIYNHKPQVIV